MPHIDLYLSFFFVLMEPIQSFKSKNKKIQTKKKKQKRLLIMMKRIIIQLYRHVHVECRKFKISQRRSYQFPRDLHSFAYRRVIRKSNYGIGCDTNKKIQSEKCTIHNAPNCSKKKTFIDNSICILIHSHLFRMKGIANRFMQMI